MGAQKLAEGIARPKISRVAALSLIDRASALFGSSQEYILTLSGILFITGYLPGPSKCSHGHPTLAQPADAPQSD